MWANLHGLAGDMWADQHGCGLVWRGFSAEMGDSVLTLQISRKKKRKKQGKRKTKNAPVAHEDAVEREPALKPSSTTPSRCQCHTWATGRAGKERRTWLGHEGGGRLSWITAGASRSMSGEERDEGLSHRVQRREREREGERENERGLQSETCVACEEEAWVARRCGAGGASLERNRVNQRADVV
eukprot:1061615-Rhodomonas_salina.6